jgi:hypothetical protein
MISALKVVAPATLEEGYSFDAIVDGRTFRVKVPEGGVQGKLMKSLSFITRKRLCRRREPLFRVLMRLEDAGVNASFLVSIPLVPVRSGWGSFVQ